MSLQKVSKLNNYKLGLFSEFIAAWYLRFRGYRILEKRYRTKVGEVDLVARKNGALIFVEVKARRDIDEAISSVTLKMQQRIRRAAEFYISQNPEHADMDMRFDLIAYAQPFTLRHLENAW